MTSGILLTLFSLILLFALALLANALSDDPGYVLLVWQHWQVQTSVGFSLLMILLLAVIFLLLFFIIRAILFGSSYYYQKRKALTRRKTLMSLDESIRHRLVGNIPASFMSMEESLTKNSLNLRPFNKKKGSALHLLQADVARLAGFFPSALEHLNHIDSDDHELATLLRAKIALDAGEFIQAQGLLDFLLSYPDRGFVEPVRESLQPAFDQHVGFVWSQLAVLQPWQMLSNSLFPNTQSIDWSGWLKSLTLAQQPEDAIERVDRLLQLMPQNYQDQQVCLLFGLLRRVGADQAAFELAQRTLADRLEITLLDQWMSLALTLADDQTTEAVNTTLVSLDQRYPAQPDVVLAQVRFARYQAQKQGVDEVSLLALQARLEPYQSYVLIQHYQLIWQIEENKPLDDVTRSALLFRLQANDAHQFVCDNIVH